MREITLHLGEDFMGVVFVFFSIILFLFYTSLAIKTNPLGSDEFVYFRYAKEIYQGKYTGFTYDGYPVKAPLMLSFVSAGLFSIFGESLAILKLVSCMFGLFTVIFLYFAVKKIKGTLPAILSVSLLLSFMLFSHFLLIGYVEVLIAFFSSAVILLLTRERKLKYGILLGIAVSLSLFAKHSGLILFPIVLIYFIWTKEYKEHKKYLFLALVIPLIIWSTFIINNIYTYQMPAIFGIDKIWVAIFGNPYPPQGAPEIEGAGQVFFVGLVSSFGMIPAFFIFLGITYLYYQGKNDITKISLIAIILFMLLSLSMFFIHEPRYLSIIYPFLVFGVSGFWEGLENLVEERKAIFYVVAIILVVIFIRESFTSVMSTSQQQRWHPSYVEGLYWIRNNTPEGSVIFTAYGGSVYYYAGRDITWVTPDFPAMMTTDNSTFIHEKLLAQDADYIYIWQGIIGDHYIIPQSNLFGIFTVRFYNAIQTDLERFNLVYNNDIGAIFKVVKNESQFNISQLQ